MKSVFITLLLLFSFGSLSAFGDRVIEMHFEDISGDIDRFVVNGITAEVKKYSDTLKKDTLEYSKSEIIKYVDKLQVQLNQCTDALELIKQQQSQMSGQSN